MPPDKVVSNKLPEDLDIQVRASGFNILWNKFKNKQRTVLVDLSDAKPFRQKNRFYILTNLRVDKLKSQFTTAIDLEKVMPDTIYLNYNKKESKTVPVHSNISLKLNKQFQLVDSILLFPATVKVSGASDVLAAIDHLETEQMELNDISKPTEVELKIKTLRIDDNVEVFPSVVKAKINVAKYTEATTVVPVEVINLPSGYSLKTFPDNVTVRYSIAFEDYEKVHPSEFKIVVDYKKIEEGSNKLKLQVIDFPDRARSIKIDPEKVEYIIRK